MSVDHVAPRATTRLPLFALVLANAISLIGNVLTMIAVPWFVLQLTNRPSQAGLVAFFTVLPAIIAGVFGGVLIDRLGYKRTSVLADLASGATVALIPTLHAVGMLDVWNLLTLVFFGALLDAPGTTARSAIVPDVAELAGMPLERATATMQVIQRGSLLVGAPLAGVLVTVMGTENVLWLNAASFAVSALLVSLAVPVGQRPGAAEAPSGYFSALRDGWQVITSDRLIRAIVLTVMITNFLDAPPFAVVMPVFARLAFGSALDLGLMVAAFGGGSLVGALIFGLVGHRLPRRATFAGAFIAVGLPFWVLATLPSLIITMAALAVSGFAAGPLNPIIHTIAYERVPPEMRGRVLGTMTAGAYIAMPLGALLAGYLIEAVGLVATLIAIAGCYLLVTASLLVNPATRAMDASPMSEL